ncbi:MAG TPA: TrkA family potassium uptake protein [Trueperaceae bacterium]
MKAREFLVIGAGRFGSAVAVTLHENGHGVVIVDEDEEAVEKIMNSVTHAMIADATDEEVLAKLGCNNFDAVIVAIGNDLEASTLATMGAKSCGAKRVIAKATSAISAKVLLRVGADEVVRPEHDMGARLAHTLITPDVVDAFELGEGHSVVEIETQEKLQGSLAELRLPRRFGVQVIAVHRRDQLVAAPGADFELRAGDRIVVVGENEAIDRLKEYITD